MRRIPLSPRDSSLSKYYEKNPYSFCEGEASATLAYSPADSPVAMFGGNSNWRGPVWMPFNYLLIEALQKFGHYYGDSLKVEFPPFWQLGQPLGCLPGTGETPGGAVPPQ